MAKDDHIAQQGPMQGLGESLKSIFERIASFFDIFDLSFFVSGAVAFSALVFWLYIVEPNVIAKVASIDGWPRVLTVILGCYVSGLISFAGGRWLRLNALKRLFGFSVGPQCLEALEGHGLGKEQIFSDYVSRMAEDGPWRLYVRLWAELRETTKTSSSNLLNRYWVMAATYDGLAFALLGWSLVLIGWMVMGCWQKACWQKGEVQVLVRVLLVGGPLAIALLISAMACMREASRFVKFQVEELVASIASMRARE